MLSRQLRGAGRVIGNTLLVVLSLAIGLAALEAGARVFASAIAKKGKLFELDPELGWRPLSNLDLVRSNANGDTWHILTDAAGIRGPSAWSDDGRTRLLVLGDSFAFGEGVELATRFDILIQERLPDLSVVNLGVMGYGPDQQLLGAKPWLKTLRRGDVLLLLTYQGNDFHDLARTRHGGRSKPWLEEVDGRILEHKPAIDLLDVLRDRSYVFTLASRSLARLGESERTQRRLETVGRLYRKWVSQQVENLMARGVLVVIVHHGDGVRELPFDVEAVIEHTCAAVSGCLALDPVLAARPRDEVFLEDGHWAAGGHRIAAERIAAWLPSLPGLGAGGGSPERPQPIPGRGETAALSPAGR